MPHAAARLPFTRRPISVLAMAMSLALCAAAALTEAQAPAKKALTIDDYTKWRSISGQKLSGDGNVGRLRPAAVEHDSRRSEARAPPAQSRHECGGDRQRRHGARFLPRFEVDGLSGGPRGGRARACGPPRIGQYAWRRCSCVPGAGRRARRRRRDASAPRRVAEPRDGRDPLLGEHRHGRSSRQRPRISSSSGGGPAQPRRPAGVAAARRVAARRAAAGAGAGPRRAARAAST